MERGGDGGVDEGAHSRSVKGGGGCSQFGAHARSQRSRRGWRVLGCGRVEGGVRIGISLADIVAVDTVIVFVKKNRHLAVFAVDTQLKEGILDFALP